jgi:hypothetical protein
MLTRGIDESWTDMRVLSTARPVSPNGRVTAILRRPGQLDLFGIDQTRGRIWTCADGASSALIRTVFPKIRFKEPSTLTGLFGMVPQEIGTLTRLKGSQEAFHTLGMPYASDPIAQTIGLPQAMNAMEVLNIARKERSLFVADLRGDVEHGRAPIQLTLAPDEVAGFWVAPLRGQSAISLPSFAIGVGGADWRRAVDLYVNRHASEWSSPTIPTWLREAGALYTYGGGGSGGIYLALPNGGTSLKSYADAADPNDCPKDDRNQPVKGTFRCALKRMLREARGLGTNVIYLNDYWQAVSSPIESCPEISSARGMWYFCKGDYFIRSDLKDPRDPDAVSTLRAAIDDVHNSPDEAGRRGRVVLYLEPFVVHKNSAVGNAFGELWGGRFPGGAVWRPFGGGDPSIEMSQANGEWQRYVVETARRLIETTHADGIFLDSAGWRLNLPTETKQEVVLNSALENSMAVLNLVDRVRAAIRSVPRHEDAVVLAETTSGPMWRHVDGGVSADFLPSDNVFTGSSTLDGRLLVSPIRYGRPQINVFSNGLDLNGLNQVFATGHGLALSSNWWGTGPLESALLGSIG